MNVYDYIILVQFFKIISPSKQTQLITIKTHVLPGRQSCHYSDCPFLTSTLLDLCLVNWGAIAKWYHLQCAGKSVFSRYKVWIIKAITEELHCFESFLCLSCTVIFISALFPKFKYDFIFMSWPYPFCQASLLPSAVKIKYFWKIICL